VCAPIGNEFMARRIVAYLTGYNLRTKASVVGALVSVDMSRKPACAVQSETHASPHSYCGAQTRMQVLISMHFVTGHDVEVQIAQPQTCQRINYHLDGMSEFCSRGD